MHETAVETIAAAELEAFAAAARRAFHEDAHPEDTALDLRTIEPGRAFVVRREGEIVATAAALSRELTVPGGAAVAAAGVSAVGVAPGHTRRGHLGRLMRRQLEEMHEAGDVVAALYASEGAIYGRYGYGLASRTVTYQLERTRAAVRPDAPRPAERPRVVAAEEARPQMAAVYERVLRTVPGLFTRTELWWDRRLHDPAHRREAGPLRAVVQPDAAGEPAGYALYGARSSWDEFGPSGEVAVRELVAATAEARAGLWEHLLGLDLTRTLRWTRAPDHDPLPYLLANADPLRHRIVDGLWVRLVDVPRALQARSYRAPFAFVIDLEDAFCPWNAGRHRLSFDGERAVCEPASGDADLAMAADALGAVYLGGTRLEALHGAGRVRELRPGALEVAASAFHGFREPWCADAF